MENQTKKKKYANISNKRSSKLYPVRYFPRNSGLIGLQNLGNTCYMNAALQALSNCPQLTTYMLEHFEQIKPGLAKNFALLLYEIWVHGCLREYSNQTNRKVFYDYLTPSAILIGIKSACPNFRSSAQQEDAQEFLRCFLDQMHEELKTPVNNAALTSDENSSNSLSNSESDDQQPEDMNLIQLDFGLSLNEELNHGDAHRSDSTQREHDDQLNHQQAAANGHLSDSNDSSAINGDELMHNASNHTNESICSIEPAVNETVKELVNDTVQLTAKQTRSNSISDVMSNALTSRSPASSPVRKMNNSSVNNLLGTSMNNYQLNEHSQITPGLGDANDLNCMDYEKENDLNVSNNPSKSNGLNGDQHKEVMRDEQTDFRGTDKHSNDLNGLANDCPSDEYDEPSKDVKMLNWDQFMNGEEDCKPIFSKETNHIDERQPIANNAATDDQPNNIESDDEQQLNQNGRETEIDSRLDDESTDQPTASQTSQEGADKRAEEKEKVTYESIISQMFNFEILNSVQCLTCKNVSTTIETFQDLSLAIPNTDDLLQTRQANSYLKSLEASSFSSLTSGKQRLREASSCPTLEVSPKSKGSKRGKAMREKNGLKYRRLPSKSDGELEPDDHQSTSKSVPSTVLSKLHKRLVKIPTIRYLFIFLLYIKYFLMAYVLYSLLSMFYWSQSNLWGPTITLSDCLDAFFSTDELKDNNMYKCEKCKKLRNGIKYMHLVKSPDILCVHFKRFRTELMFPSKISTYVSFPLKGLSISSHMMESPKSENKPEEKSEEKLEEKPEEKQPQLVQESDRAAGCQETDKSNSSMETGSFDMSGNLSSHLKLKRKNEVYDLVSVICHRGHYNAGHYITYALNCLDECWYEYDDKSVRKVDENKVLNCEAYLLFFKRVTSTKPAEQDELRNEPDERRLLNDYEYQQVNQNETNNTQKLSFFRKSFANRSGEASSGDEAHDRQPILSLSKGELFRKRKYEKIRGELDYLNQTNDILGDLKL